MIFQVIVSGFFKIHSRISREFYDYPPVNGRYSPGPTRRDYESSRAYGKIYDMLTDSNSLFHLIG